ncbi:PucR family transcriptional regulator [Streptomyces sp. NPDC004822]
MSPPHGPRSSNLDSDLSPLDSLCEWAEEQSAEIVASIVKAVRSEVKSFTALPMTDHEEYTLLHFKAFLGGLKEARLPSDANLELARSLGRTRAAQLVPMESVIDAVHIGYRCFWTCFVHETRKKSIESQATLLDLAEYGAHWLQLVCRAVADGYAETALAQKTSETELSHRFIEALYAGVHGEDVVALARALNFNPYADFQAGCTTADVWAGEHFDRIRQRLHVERGTLHAARLGDLVIIIAQHVNLEKIERLLPPHSSQAIGIGVPRVGLNGATESISDAEMSLTLAKERNAQILFHEKWLIATLLPHRERLAPLLATSVPGTHPHLAEAVLAFAHSGFSITASAASLRLHPNTVSYRLDRWYQHTGWDPRSWDGLARSLANIVLYKGHLDGRRSE